ncbi:LacI family DNA-binding transcriptional regulator [Croceibacterium mercuriale]|uniref:LacI family DNA-binding transcriptional regulator n=1 Tax=Croceibacterium mercuriale TaxID=1572751 RepID=UPI001379309D|nr:LacI family DNA-binding transcriptional regulator [Croceibacterium mercuriale]
MDGRKAARVATMQDVARAAGVSHMTVSRVVNGHGAVRPETRRLVEAAITALNFAPNPLARALNMGAPQRIALLHRFPNPGTLGVFLLHLLDRAAKAHANLEVREVHATDQDAQVVADLVERRVTGVILAPPLADDPVLVTLLRAGGLGIVASGSVRPDAKVVSVGIDDQAAAHAMTQHLLHLGHRSIGFITGHPDHASSTLRLAGYHQAMRDADIPVPPGLVGEGLYTYQSGLAAAEALLGAAHRPSAIFASNDDMAAATLAVAHRRGLAVPGDLSIAGFDDSVLATTVWPTLTTVRAPARMITRTAFDLVLQAVSGGQPPGDAPHRVCLPFELVTRESTAPLDSGLMTAVEQPGGAPDPV